MKLIKKISIKTVVGNVKAIVKEMDEGESRIIMRVIGKATGSKVGESTYGAWEALKGDFKATNMETGEQFRSGVAFLPDVALDLVIGALNGGDVSSVDFGFDIGVTEDSDSNTGYVYNATPLLEVKESDPIAMLEKSLNIPQLEHMDKTKKEKSTEKVFTKKSTKESAAA
jgi:hypothetical protein